MSSPNYFLELIARANQMVEAELIDEDGTDNVFETDQVITDTPTLYITLDDPKCKRFLLEEVTWMMNPTAVETYQLVLFEEANADNVISLSKIVFDSGALLVDSQAYMSAMGQGKLPRIVDLTIPGRLYYMLLWTGAPGDTPGYVKVRGRKMG